MDFTTFLNQYAAQQLPRLPKGGAQALFSGYRPPQIPPQFRLPQQQPDGMASLQPQQMQQGPMGSSVVNAPPLDMQSDAPVTAGPSSPLAPNNGGASLMPSAAKVRMGADMTGNSMTPPGSQNVKMPTIAPDFTGTTLDTSTPKIGKADLPLGGTYDGDTNTSSWLGGAVSYKPVSGQSDTDRMKMAGATLKDMAAGFNNQDSNNLGDQQDRQRMEQQRQHGLDALTQVQQQLQKANGDPTAMRAALVNYAMAGGNPAELTGAMNYGRPTYQSYKADENVVAIGPDGRPTGVLQRGSVAPKTEGGMQWTAQGGWQPVPGYAQQQQSIYGAKLSSRLAAQQQFQQFKNGAGAGPNSPINITPPWALH